MFKGGMKLNMKKGIVITIAIVVPIIVVISIIGIGYFFIQYTKVKISGQKNMLDSEYTNIELVNRVQENNIYTKDFGSYKLPKNWIESKEHSTTKKFFYVLKGEEKNIRPNNIAINFGTNRYSKEEHEKFRRAILTQLSTQIAGKNGVEINANGSTTNNGDILYTFIIKEANGITTFQYYIVGDYKYILIQETVFEESEEIDTVVKGMISSFRWNDK